MFQLLRSHFFVAKLFCLSIPPSVIKYSSVLIFYEKKRIFYEYDI